MSVAPDTTVVLQDRFSRALPELAVPWQAEVPAEPELLLLNEALATDLGLDPAWLRGPDGLRFLIGNHVPAGAVPAVAVVLAAVVVTDPACGCPGGRHASPGWPHQPCRGGAE